jgi:hypothetical protein
MFDLLHFSHLDSIHQGIYEEEWEAMTRTSPSDAPQTSNWEKVSVACVFFPDAEVEGSGRRSH